MRMPLIRALALAMLLALPSHSTAQRETAMPAQKRAPDLADRLAGSYEGDVISDARGASRSGVGITITRTGKNTIRVVSDYARIPAATIMLTKAMDSIVAASGRHVILVNLAEDPGRLDLTIDDASWSGRRVAPR